MRVLRLVPLIALVRLTMGINLALIGRAHQKTTDAATGPPTSTAQSQDPPETCPITKPPAQPFVPPSPYPSKTGPDGFWFGTDKLWTQLGTDGTWKSLPHWPNGTFRQKLFWFHQGYDWHNELQPMLEVTGKRLDSPAPPLETDEHANNGWTNDSHHPFIVVGINLPALGCWKITGHYKDVELSFVVWVTH